MDKQPQNEQKELSAQEKRDMEMAAITLLDQIGVSFNIPLRKEEIEFFTKKKSLFKKIFHRVENNPLPSGVKVNVRKMPNPDDPAQQIDYYEGGISIRPLRLATIDAMRYKRLELESKEPQLKEHLESTDANDIYLFNYTKEILEILAIATLNLDDFRGQAEEIEQWVNFYRRHLTNPRYSKLVQVVMMMMDAPSFRNSTRLMLGLGTTAPREASRVVKAPSKD